MTPAAVFERLAGSLQDRYRLERELGAGGMATVYLAEDIRHHRKVAIKVLHPELSAVLGPERFLREIELTANLQHPHVLPLFDSGAADGLLFYVMPYVEGETLRGRLQREHQIPVPTAVRIATEVAEALEYAHKRGVIHRDIKPENILLQEGRPLVADFGIALAVEQAGGVRMTQTGMSLGTPQYMAPEQAMGDRGADHRADIYALGAVVYEMLAGEPPFTGPTSQAILARVITEEPRSLRAQRKAIPQQVENAVLTALEKVPADRFATAGEFANALAGDAPTTTRRSSVSRESATSPVRERRFSPALVGVIAAVAAFAALGGWIAHTPKPADRLRLRFVLPGDSTQTLGSSCCGYQLAVSPDEKKLVYVAVQNGTSFLFVRDLDGQGSQPLTGTDGATEAIYSPDGQWIAFRIVRRAGAGIGDYELRKISAGGGASTLIANTAGWPYGGTWTDDGTIVYASDPGGLFKVSAAGGTPEQVAGTDSASHPWFVRESNSILFTQRRNGRFLVRDLSLADGRIRDVAEGRAPAYLPEGYLLSTTGNTLTAQPFNPGKARLSGGVVVLADDLARLVDYTVTPGGLLVYGSGMSGGVLDAVDSRGSARPLPFRIEGSSHFDNPRYSPDGRHIAVSAGQSPGHTLVVFDLAAGTSLRLTFSGNTEFLSWMPDGRSLLYVKENTKLAVQPADRSSPERVLLSAAAGREIAGVTTGGRWIAYAVRAAQESRGASLGSDIFVAPIDSPGFARPYQATPFSESAPMLSRDGKWMAYVSDETGRPEVYVSGVPVPGARQVISATGGREPVWSADGRTLYYRTPRGELMAVSLSRGPELSLTGRTTFFRSSFELSPDGADFAVHPTDGTFLMLRSRATDTRLIVVTDALAATRSNRSRSLDARR